MSLDVKSIATWIGIAGSLGGVAGTWMLLQYRLEEVEKTQQALSIQVEALREANQETGEEVKCLICAAHNIQCPGCSS